MHKVFGLIASLIFCLNSYAQSGSGIGVKGGINFANSGRLGISVFNGANNLNDFPVSKGTNLEFGYHVGIFGKFSFADKFYFRPELIFTKRQNEYDITGTSDQENLNISSFDFPLLIGVKISGPLSFFIGPSFSYNLSQDIESQGNFENLDLERDITLGFNAGFAFAISQFGIDIRYERSFGENLLNFRSSVNNSFSGTIDTRYEQIILSLSYKLL